MFEFIKGNGPISFPGLGFELNPPQGFPAVGKNELSYKIGKPLENAVSFVHGDLLSVGMEGQGGRALPCTRQRTFLKKGSLA